MRMKKVILFTTLFSMISLFGYSKDPVKQWGQLQVKGNQLCSQAGEPIVLRGVSYGWHNLWPRFYNKQSVKWLKKDWKCTVLRAAMGTVIEDNYIENPEFALKCMNKVIKAAIKNDIYVIIDWHTYYPQKEEAVKKAVEKAITLEEVRSVLANLSRSGQKETVLKLLQKYGGSRLSEVPPERYAALFADAQEAAHAE